MPNTRRRRFSVQNNTNGRDSFKLQKSLQTSKQEPNSESSPRKGSNLGLNTNTSKSTTTNNRSYPNSSKNVSALDLVAQDVGLSSITTANIQPITHKTVEKEVTATSSIIDSSSIPYAGNISTPSYENLNEHRAKNLDTKIVNKERVSRKEKYIHQHRVKVRSPKRRILSLGTQNTFNENNNSIGISPVEWNELAMEEMDVTPSIITEIELVETVHNVENNRLSSHSVGDMCRICHGGESLSFELGPLLEACSCRGTVGRVHVKCLERWLTESGKSRCELCGTRYSTRKVHKYGVPRSLFMWILSQNSKQLMVDTLGIILMSPLAVLAAWLSGRTLAGLMTQEAHVAPWPLASTFVLACMTLVCYYCWIVSAATRHALSWWIWYRSQYEVRLQLRENEAK